MRTIKFRAWDKERSRFDERFPRELKDFGELGWTLTSNEFEFQQFTGLLDKNGDTGQEVYEGDIIDKEGIIKGNIYESPQIYEKGIDLLIEGMGTKEWRNTESIAMGRGCRYAE